MEINDIPIELLVILFSFLPKVYLPFVCALVCNKWNFVIEEHFARTREFLFSYGCQREFIEHMPTSMIKKEIKKNNSLADYIKYTNNRDIAKWAYTKEKFSEDKIITFAFDTKDQQLFKWINKRQKQKLNLKRSCYSKVIQRMIIDGPSDLFKWMNKKGYVVMENYNKPEIEEKIFWEGRLDLLKWFNNMYGIEKYRIIYSKIALRVGNIGILDWMKHEQFSFTEELDISPVQSAGGLYVTEKYDIKTLEWALEEGIVMTEYFCKKLLSTGDINLIRWVLEKKLVSLFDIDNFVAFTTISMCRNYVHVLKWLDNYCENNNKKMEISARTCQGAFSRKVGKDVIEWYKTNKLNNGNLKTALLSLMKKNRTQPIPSSGVKLRGGDTMYRFLKNIKKYKLLETKEVYEYLFKNFNLSYAELCVLQNTGFEIDKEIFSLAIEHGSRIYFLKMLRRCCHFEFDADLFEKMAKHGGEYELQWLKKRCPWDIRTYNAIVSRRTGTKKNSKEGREYERILKWIIEEDPDIRNKLCVT